MRSALFGLVVFGIGLSACEDTRSCQNSCRRAFRDEQCNFQVPGAETPRLIRDCVTECEIALRQTGDLNGYDPDVYGSVDRAQTFTLENEAQAAAWMDCVAETSCEDINEGFCPGGGIN